MNSPHTKLTFITGEVGMDALLKEATLSYIQFMGDVGHSKTHEGYESKCSTVFCKDVVKNENGAQILRGAAQLLHQLRGAREFAFPWKIDVLNIICDPSQKASSVRFTWNSEKVGLHITTAILTFDDEMKVSQIIEVYNKYADITH